MVAILAENLKTSVRHTLRQKPELLYCSDGRRIKVLEWEVILKLDAAAKVSLDGVLIDMEGQVITGAEMYDGLVLVCPRGVVEADNGNKVEPIVWQVTQRLEDIRVHIAGFVGPPDVFIAAGLYDEGGTP